MCISQCGLQSADVTVHVPDTVMVGEADAGVQVCAMLSITMNTGRNFEIVLSTNDYTGIMIKVHPKTLYFHSCFFSYLSYEWL